MLVWLWLTVPVALLLSLVHPRVWIKLDVKRFVKDGAANSLLQLFHRQRLTWRAVIGGLICAVAVCPLWGVRWWPLAGHRWPLVLAVLAVAAWQGGYWLYYFNPNLSRARHLDYVGPYHVSWVADASWLDRHVWAWAARQVYPDRAVTHEPDPAIIAVAAPRYEKLLAWCLWAGVGLALLLGISSILVRST